MAKEVENTEQMRAQAALLLSQARAQSSEIEQALAAVSATSAVYSHLSAAAQQTSSAIRQLSEALQSRRFPLRQGDLMALQSIVTSGEIRTLIAAANLARSDSARSDAAHVQAVAMASASTRSEVQTDVRDIFEKKMFDPYLRFSSREDEAEFRKREAETKKYIEAQLAKKTPEGDLNAAGGMQGQMLDAHAHGAGASPEFTPRWHALAEKADRQRDAMHAAGQSTQEYDSRIDDSVRRYLKTKGLSEAEINARLSGAARPLDAVKPYLGGDRQSRHSEKTASTVTVEPAETAPADLPRVASATEPSPSPAILNLDAINAKLKAAGVQMAAKDDTETGHGLPAQPKKSQIDRTVSV